MKFPKVLVEANPTAALPRAEKATTQSGGMPSTLIRVARAPNKIKRRKTQIKPTVTWGDHSRSLDKHLNRGR